MNMISENRVYKLDVISINGKNAERGKIAIDSKAADNVMPVQELTEVPMQSKEPGVNFTYANGKPMANHGRKDIQFVPFVFWVFGYPSVGLAE